MIYVCDICNGMWVRHLCDISYVCDACNVVFVIYVMYLSEIYSVMCIYDTCASNVCRMCGVTYVICVMWCTYLTYVI